jgi:WD40 repeat protein
MRRIILLLILSICLLTIPCQPPISVVAQTETTPQQLQLQLVQKFPGILPRIISLSPCGKYIAGFGLKEGAKRGGVDTPRELRVWATSDGTELLILPKRVTGHVSFLQFSPDGEQITVINNNMAGLRSWNIKDGKATVSSLNEHLDDDNSPLRFAYAPNNRLIAVEVPRKRQISIYSILDREEKMAIDIPSLQVIADLHFTPDSKHLAIALNVYPKLTGSTRRSSDLRGRLVIWDLTTRKVALELNNLPSAISSMQLSPSGDVLAIGGMENDDSGTKLIEWRKHNPEIIDLPGQETYDHNSLAFSPDGKFLFSSGFNKRKDQKTYETSIQVWDWRAKTLHSATVVQSPTAIALSPDGKYLYTATFPEESQLQKWQLPERFHAPRK